jgi:predicted site-specific integrase-resolvase
VLVALGLGLRAMLGPGPTATRASLATQVAETKTYLSCHLYKTKCYIGSAINLKRRFNTHYKSYKNNKHPKFYSCVKAIAW